MVGAKGFEPSTSWSRTNHVNPITLYFGVAYGTRSPISPPLVVPNLYLEQQAVRRIPASFCFPDYSGESGYPVLGSLSLQIHRRSRGGPIRARLARVWPTWVIVRSQ